MKRGIHFGWMLSICLLISLSFMDPECQAAERKPVIILAGFESRVTCIDAHITEGNMLPVVRETLYEKLIDTGKYTIRDISDETQHIQMDEKKVRDELGEGRISPQLKKDAAFIIYGYLTHISNVKAQSGVLGIRGKDVTVSLELTLRVVDARTGVVVFAAKGDARRKSELKYNVILSRNDKGYEDAVENALRIAAVNLADEMIRMS